MKRKWRPSLGLITTALIASVLVLPLIGLIFFRLYENQLLRQTEAEVIAQGAMLAAIYAREIETVPPGAFPIGVERPPLPPEFAGEPYAPIPPTLDLAMVHVETSRPSPRLPGQPPDPRALELGAAMSSVLVETQRTTLAGFRLLDAEGRVIAGRDEIGMSLAHVPEVREALTGRHAIILRRRNSDEPDPPLYSISRGTRIRIFAAFPVFVDEHVRGVVLISRTPDNIVRSFYREREKLALVALLILIAAAAIGAAFVRTVTRPIGDLVRRADAISRGERDDFGPLKWHGASEIAHLTQSFMSMAKRLSDRSDYLSTFASHVTHELKTPLTAIKGAVELLRDNEPAMSEEARRRFLDNILSDSTRMSVLLDRLRELAKADNPETGGACDLSELIDALRARFEDVAIESRVDAGAEIVPMSAENASIVFANLIDNARRCGAGRIQIEVRRDDTRIRIRVSDDGQGVSEGNRQKIFDAFFTTRRAEGGAGMGLMIVRALLRAHEGDIALLESETGAAFELTLPSPPAPPQAQATPFEWLKRALARLSDR